MNQPDLFDVGERQTIPMAEWRLSKRGPCVPAPIGTGPKGETCRSCAHYCTFSSNVKVVRKCGLMCHHWTHGPGSDIKAKWPACRMWVKP